jgi:hypothetical protein
MEPARRYLQCLFNRNIQEQGKQWSFLCLLEKIKGGGKPLDAGEGTTSSQIADKEHHHNMKPVHEIDFSTTVMWKRASFVGWKSEWKVYWANERKAPSQ